MYFPGKAVPHDCDLLKTGCYAPWTHVLIFCGVILLLMILIIMISRRRDTGKDHQRLSDFVQTVQMHLTYAFAFCMMTLTRWMVDNAKRWSFTMDVNGMDVNNAIFHSAIWSKTMNVLAFWPLFGVFLIFTDKLADHNLLSERCAHKMIKGMCLATAVFTEVLYNQAVETSVGAMLQRVYGKHAPPFPLLVWELFAVGSLLALVIPAWAMYIAPLAMHKVPRRASSIIGSTQSQSSAQIA